MPLQIATPQGQRDMTPEEEDALLEHQQQHLQDRQRFEELQLSARNVGVRKQAQIDRLEKQLQEELDSNNLNALRTQAAITRLKTAEV